MLVDSTVFIDYLRGNKKAKEFLLETKKPLITSIIVVMEIVIGFSRKKDVSDFLHLLEELDIETVHISTSISYKSLELFTQHYPYGLGIADSFIAATAYEEKQAIATHNTKHFSLLEHFDIVVPY